MTDRTTDAGAGTEIAPPRAPSYLADVLLDRRTLITLAATIAAIIVVPMVLNALWLRVFISSAIFTIAASGTAVLYARLGLVSLAQVALVGVGGWVTLRMYHALHLPFEINMLAGAVVSSLVGVVIGLPALRMRGLFLALITLMAAAGFEILVTGTQFPNGGFGVLGIAVNSIFMPRPLLATTDEAMLRYVCVVAVIIFALIALIRRAKPGRAWALIRKSEACAMAAGINVAFYKAWGFALAGFVAGISGALLAATIGVLDATSFPASESILLFALTVVGGAYSILGQILAGVLYRVIPAFFNNIGIDGNIAYVIFGIALVHAIITAPQGIAGQIGDAVGALRKRLARA